LDTFLYKKAAGITAMSASLSEFKYKLHAHAEYAIGVTLRGIQQYRMDGSLQMSHRNGVMIFNPEQVHDGMAHDETGLDYVMLYIDPALLLEATGKKEIVRFSNPVVYDDGLARRIVSLARTILSERDDALCSEAFLSLADRLVAADPVVAGAKKDNAAMSKAKEMLRGNLDHVLKLEEICAELGLSKFQLIRSFKAYAGISPYQYFLNLKVEQAKRTIEGSGDIYMAVASCGFFDLAHLNKHFKGTYGTTAHEYLLQMQR